MPLFGIIPAVGILTRVGHLARAGKNVGTWFANFVSKHPVITAGVISIPLATEFVKTWNATPDVQKVNAINELAQINPDLAKALIDFEIGQQQEKKILIIFAGLIVVLVIIIFIFKFRK